jgi:uncharacterized protein (TIGR03089 family)
VSTPVPAPCDVPRLLHLLQAEPQPRLTWVSRDGDRVELSGRVLVNWVAKTAGLLQDECDLQPDGVLRTALGPSWRAPVLWLAAWHLGARVTAHGPDGPPDGADRDADVWVVPDGAPAPAGDAVVVVVAPATLATRSGDGRVASDGWVDYAAEVRQHPDSLPPGEPWTGAAAAPRGAGGARVLLGHGAGPEELLAVWADGGSVVWHDGLTADALDRLAEQEHATR